MQPAIIVDRDGTLADVEFSRQFLEGDRPDWASFNGHIPFDPVVPGVQALVQTFRGVMPEAAIIMTTGREDRFRGVMKDWLNKYNITITHLFMRDTGDNRPDHVVKEEIYHTHIENVFDVLFVVDDRPSVVLMWKQLGLPVVQVISSGIVPPLYQHEHDERPLDTFVPPTRDRTLGTQ